MKVIDNIFDRARANPKRIVLAEGNDPRILTAAQRVTREGLAHITAIGNEESIQHQAKELGIDLNSYSSWA